MHSLQLRVTVTVFATTVVVVLGLMLVVNYQVSENFSSYLYMSGMHGMMMNHGNMAAMMGAPERQFLISLRYSLAVAAGVMLLIGAVVSYYLARSIAAPVIDLNRAVNDVAAGNLDVAVAVDRQDEVGQLAAAFNAMTAKLKANTVLRQRFLAGVAHELRTPLTILKANLEGIADGVIVPDQEQIKSLTEEVDRLTKMVGELRDLSLLETGQLTPDYTEIDLHATLRQVIQKSAPLAAEKNLALSLKIDDSLPRIWADAGMLQQMVYNLLLNAIRYTPAGSVTVTAKGDGTAVTIEVIDTGIGIAADDIEHIFDYFYRVDPARTKQSGGTGLGLALVKQMALAHGGQVYATSTPGQGSTFTLKLPLRARQKRIVSP
ncbi:integral membrane sensor signal transduction histidine kinase [Thermosinus carboxydivorans Nor1]|uniref:histidine kinase n=1 Tax=Thermosinus carboxydivorans Nor1 TaxID=401526 RepID=A1HRL9_9FIRM|nr:HAMP domain-containing sensor histidine kinase [Thermosinus carboxydivorans]EAX47346.1 integral membrane sensor signal transduction histidine kinase [Thermosinus carboxydivorans Nor1]